MHRIDKRTCLNVSEDSFFLWEYPEEVFLHYEEVSYFVSNKRNLKYFRESLSQRMWQFGQGRQIYVELFIFIITHFWSGCRQVSKTL